MTGTLGSCDEATLRLLRQVSRMPTAAAVTRRLPGALALPWLHIRLAVPRFRRYLG